MARAKVKSKPSRAKVASKKAAPSKKAKKSDDSFIPDDAVSSGASRYMKFKNGDNKIRIISKPIAGWLEWVDKKPLRTPLDEEPEIMDDENRPKKFLAMAVIDRNDDDKVKIMELTQQSIIKAIKALAANEDWGNPFSYDLTITKTGEDLKTKYVVTPSPKKALPESIMEEAEQSPCNLDALYEGEDPWDVEDEVTEYEFE